MLKYRLQLILLSLLMISCSSHHGGGDDVNAPKSSQAYDVKLIQFHAVKQSDADVEGLDNARAAALTPDNKQMLVVSADDNSVAIFDINSGFVPSLRQVIRSDDLYQFSDYSERDSLAGASNLVLSSDGQYAYVVSFYGSSLLVLSRGENGDWAFHQLLTDGLTAERIFKDERPLGELDTLGILGAWDVDITPDDSQLFVTGYQSGALSVFDLAADGKARLRRMIKDGDQTKYALSGAVGVKVSTDGSLVLASSFEENAVTIFSRSKGGELKWQQTLSKSANQLSELVNPQSLLLASDNRWLYVACSESGSLMSFKRDSRGMFQHTQTITGSESEQLFLYGAGSLAMTSDGQYLLVTAEMDNSLNYFQVKQNGDLVFKPNEGLSENGLSSVMITANDEFAITTAGQGDSVTIYRIVKQEINE